MDKSTIPMRQKPTISKPPSFLDATAKREWKRISKLLGDRLSEIDQAVLVAYASAWSQFVRAEKVLQEQGEVVEFKTKAGSWKIPHPSVKLRSDAAARLLKTSKLLGLSSSTKRVPKPKSPGDRFLRG